MKRIMSTLGVVLGLVAGTSAEATAGPQDTQAQAAAQGSEAKTHLSGRFLTLGHYRTDSDFDPSPRFFDRDGQSEGQVATFFAPLLQIEASDRVSVRYEAELGWNAWSRHDPGFPNPYFESQRPGLNLRHRQILGEVGLSKQARLTVGYQHFADPSRLFVDHVLGAARLVLGDSAQGLTLLLGQLPDDTYEGMLAGDDNFVQDNALLIVQAKTRLAALSIDTGLYGVADGRQVGRPLHLGVALLGARGEAGNLQYYGYGLGQFGRWQRAGLGGEDVNVRAYALTAGLATGRRGQGLRYGGNTFLLSGDDESHGNATLGAFFSSAKNHSPTRYLTEDEDRDRYDNLDERLGTIWGPFFYNRAGLLIVDAFLGWTLLKVDMTLVLGHGMVLAPDNILGEGHVGTEATLQSQFNIGAAARLFGAATAFLPQGAAAARVNDIDREATEAVFALQLGLHITF